MSNSKASISQFLGSL